MKRGMGITTVSKNSIIVLVVVIIVSSTLFYLRSEITHTALEEHTKILMEVKETQQLQNNILNRIHHLLNQSEISLSVLQANLLQTRLDGSQIMENQRTLFTYLDDHREILENITNELSQP